MKLTDLNLQELIKKAEKQDACRSALTFLRSCSSIEEVLANKNAPEYAYWYAENVMKCRWVEAEPLILTKAELAYAYSRDVIKGVWQEAEPIILTDPYCAYMYARDVVNDDAYTYWYARHVIRGPWEVNGKVYNG